MMFPESIYDDKNIFLSEKEWNILERGEDVLRF